MTHTLQKIADAKWFQLSITIVIVIAGIVVGADTYSAVRAKYGTILDILNEIILWIFVVEVLVKMGSKGKKPWKYFQDGWNIFDFLIVATAFLPFAGSQIAILRLIRLLRVLRLVTTVRKLQLLVSTLIRSIPSMGYVGILLFLLFYIYAVAGVIFWGENDPYHFADIETSMLSLFRVVTLEDWTDVMYIQMYGCTYGLPMNHDALCKNPSGSPLGGALFFVSFVLIGTMIMLNLFIGVIMNSMDEAKVEYAEMEAENAGTTVATISETVLHLRGKLKDIEDLIIKIENHNKQGKE